MSGKQPLVQVGVFDQDGKCLEHADVRLEPEQAGRKVRLLRWDRSRGCHVAPRVAAGRYRLVAQALGHEPGERRVEVGSGGLRSVILLGVAGLPFLYRGEVRTPFQPRPDRFVIALDETMSKDAVTKVDDTAEQEGLASEFQDLNGQPPRHARVFRFPSGSSAASRRETVTKLLAIAGVHLLGPPVHFDKDESVSCLTDELVVRFRPGVTRAQIDELARRCDLTMLRQLVVAGNMFVFRMPGPLAYEMLDVANEIASSDLVVYAEPNLISIGVHDVIGRSSIFDALQPTDFLFPMQWHLRLMRCPQAWQLIRDKISPHRAMGSPEITIAVVDWGIDIGNPEFAGNLANGEPKVSAAFDFHNMTAGNNGRSHGHGTGCAGVATALPDNDGGCGVAGTCRLMAIRRPEGIMASEAAYSDMYLWIAGLDPKSPTQGFPQPIRPGADVISSSFGYAAGLPISGLMRDTFDLLAERGRDGRGVLLFFSTGNNYPPVDFTLLRPWAAHERTCAVGASTLAPGGMAEMRAKQSNFGGAAVLDFCAPSATALGADYDPPRTYAVVTAADGNSTDPDPNLQPNAPSECGYRTTTSTDAAANDKILEVLSTTEFSEKMFVLIGTPGTWSAEFNQIVSISASGARFELQKPLKNPHPRGTPICAGPTHSLHSFGGTSCATALAAGVGALLLSAYPELSLDEARKILRATAVKIDAANADATGIWRDADGIVFGNRGYAGPHYSRGYGFGRIDAAAAVGAALARRSFWTRAAARVTAALGFHRCGGGDTHRG